MRKMILLAGLIICPISLHAADSSREQKVALLCFEAKRWVGVLEEGTNSGQLIKIFQCACDERASQEPWCMAFAQYCIKMTEGAYTALFPQDQDVKSTIFRSEHCLTTWNKSSHLRIEKPIKGSLCIWQKYDGSKPTTSGHTGIVIEVQDNGTISVLEGNTAPRPDGAIEREGDGVYLKRYKVGQMDQGSMKLKGFLNVWSDNI